VKVGRRLTSWIFCACFIAALPVMGSINAAAASPAPSRSSAGGATHLKPFLPETARARASSRSHVLKPVKSAPVIQHSMGKVGATVAGGSRVNSHASPLIVSTQPDVLATSPGLSQVGDLAAHGSDQDVAPPDTDIAVSQSDVVRTVNSTIEVRSRTGALLASNDLNTFLSVDSTHYSADPRVIYDSWSQRWWLTITQVANNFTCSGVAAPVLIAVSASSNPLPFSSWIVYELPLVTAGTFLADQPGLGISANTVAVSWSNFNCSGGFLGSDIDILQRTDLELGTVGPKSDAPFTDTSFAPQPVQSFGGGSTMTTQYVVVNDSDCAPSVCASPVIEVDAFTGTPEGAGGVSTNTTSPAMTPTLVDGTYFGTPPAQQSGTSTTINTDDDRFLNAVWENGHIWTADGTECTPALDSTPRSCLDYVGVTASNTGVVNPTVTQINNVGVNGSYLSYPAVSLDSAGDVFTVFNESSSSTFPTIMSATIPAGGSTLSAFQTVHASSTFYNPLSFACQTIASTNACRWGDYSGAAQDPSNPKHVWVVSEAEDGLTSSACPSPSECWGSDIAQLTVAPPVITSLNPAYGPVVGGQTVTVDGTDFGLDTTATFNGSSIPITNLTPTSFRLVTPPSGSVGTTTAQIQATDVVASSTENAASLYTYLGLSNYTSVPPFRILDTRAGSTCVQCSTNPTFGPGVTEKLQLTGVTGLKVTDPIPSNATAVVLNLTEVAGTANSLLTMYPFGSGLRPVVSNLNFPPGKVISNLVTVTLGVGGAVSVYNALGSVNVVVDVEGYFTPQAASDFQGLFHPIAPVRVCDTRSSCDGHGAVGAGQSVVVTVNTAGEVPNDGTAGAVVVNLTGVVGTASTYLSLFPTDANGQCHPTGTSTINLLPGAVAGNRVMVELGPTSLGGPTDALCVFNAAGSINVIVDANGWYGSGTATASPAGFQYQALGPTRICDTRVASTSCSTGAIGAGTASQRLITVAGHAGVPAFGSSTTVAAMIANLTGITPTATTYLTLSPTVLTHAPGFSDLNLAAGTVVNNLAAVGIDTNGSDPHPGDVELFNAVGSVNVTIDLEGWFQ
jgi:IPT/TIG domain